MSTAAAKELGCKGGKVSSPAKTAACKKNAQMPRGKWVTAIAYELDGVEDYKAFGCILVRGRVPSDADTANAWIINKVRENGVGLKEETHFEFLELATTSMRV